MKNLVQPYLFFEGRCEEAIEFYKKAAGAQVTMLMRFKDSPEPPPPGCMPPGSENKIMHAQLQIGEGVVLMADGRCTGKMRFDGFSLSLIVGTEAEAEQRFAALAEGGKAEMALGKTFFSPKFGILEDKFGVRWMVLVRPEQPR